MAVMEGCVVRGEEKEEGGTRGARYQFSLRGKTVAAPLIDRKILICLTRELLQLREEKGEKGDESEATANRSLTQRRQRWMASGTQDRGARGTNEREREKEKKNISSRCRDARSETHTS